VILFLDTSALVKLYVQEPHWSTVEKAIQSAKSVVVSEITLAEAVSALDYRIKNNDLSKTDQTLILKQLLEDWNTFDCVPINDYIIQEALMLMRAQELRKTDAIQLATAAWVSRVQRSLYFLTFDWQLSEAAQGIVRVLE
jgi:uncharacterized protein